MPVNGTVKWDEFAQRYQTEPRNLLPTWEQMPSHMLGKVAESLALRRAFPEVAAAVALMGPEEDDTTMVAEVSASVPDETEPERDTSTDTEGDSTVTMPGADRAGDADVSRSDSDVVARAEALDIEARNALGMYTAGASMPWPPETDRDRKRVARWLDTWERDQ